MGNKLLYICARLYIHYSISWSDFTLLAVSEEDTVERDRYGAASGGNHSVAFAANGDD